MKKKNKTFIQALVERLPNIMIRIGLLLAILKAPSDALAVGFLLILLGLTMKEDV